jgi:mono/diheme cytochrome c family protein
MQTAALDLELMRRGDQLFQTKGCVGCHTIGNGRLTGPDLAGITQRREFEWIVAMVTTPDSMLREDPVARQLFAEYMTPMVTVGANREGATAIYEFLRGKVE